MQTGGLPLPPLRDFRRICAGNRRGGSASGDNGVTFHHAIPGRGKQRTVAAGAEAIGALAAHPDRARGQSDAAGTAQRGKEAELALGRPAVAAGFTLYELRLGSAHRPAWNTSGDE